jgi:hypothetical protein
VTSHVAQPTSIECGATSAPTSSRVTTVAKIPIKHNDVMSSFCIGCAHVAKELGIDDRRAAFSMSGDFSELFLILGHGIILAGFVSECGREASHARPHLLLVAA